MRYFLFVLMVSTATTHAQQTSVGALLGATATFYQSSDVVNEPCDDYSVASPWGYEYGLAFKQTFGNGDGTLGILFTASFRQESGFINEQGDDLPGLDSNGNVVITTVSNRTDVITHRFDLNPSLVLEFDVGLGVQVGPMFEYLTSGRRVQALWAPFNIVFDPRLFPEGEGVEWFCSGQGLVTAREYEHSRWQIGLNLGVYWTIDVGPVELEPYALYRISQSDSFMMYEITPAHRLAAGVRVMLPLQKHESPQ